VEKLRRELAAAVAGRGKAADERTEAFMAEVGRLRVELGRKHAAALAARDAYFLVEAEKLRAGLEREHEKQTAHLAALLEERGRQVAAAFDGIRNGSKREWG
jgi:hypothetical protein